MFKLWIVFPPDLQPTIAQAKIWNANTHELRGVHWGTEQDRPDILAVEAEAESLRALLRHREAFDLLVQAWLRQGAEIRDSFEFAPDRNALKPVRKAPPDSPADVRILPSPARFWEPKIRPHAAPSKSTADELAARHSGYQQPGLRGQLSRAASRGGPWLIAGLFAAGTIGLGGYLARALNLSGIETRRDTIQRIDDSTRHDPRTDVAPNTRISVPVSEPNVDWGSDQTFDASGFQASDSSFDVRKND